MPIGAVIGGSAIIGAGASISASNKAAKTAKATAATNNTLQTDTYNQNKAALAPYVQAGIAPTNSIQALLGGTGSAAQTAAFGQFRNEDGYNFRVAEGTKAVTAGLGARGMLDSGAAQKSLTNYAQNAASDEFAKYYSMLTGQQAVGAQAAAAQAGVGTGYANAVSANNNAASNTVSNAALSNASTINGALGSAVSAYGYSQGLGLKSSYGTTGAHT